MKKYVKTQEKTQNSRGKLKKSALLGFLGAGKASKKPELGRIAKAWSLPLNIS